MRARRRPSSRRMSANTTPSSCLRSLELKHRRLCNSAARPVATITSIMIHRSCRASCRARRQTATMGWNITSTVPMTTTTRLIESISEQNAMSRNQPFLVNWGFDVFVGVKKNLMATLSVPADSAPGEVILPYILYPTCWLVNGPLRSFRAPCASIFGFFFPQAASTALTSPSGRGLCRLDEHGIASCSLLPPMVGFAL
jgi:hypothetical protein